MTEQLRLSPEPRESPSKHISRPGKFSNYYSIDERYSHVAGVLRQQAIFDDYMTNTGNDTLQFFSEEGTELPLSSRTRRRQGTTACSPMATAWQLSTDQCSVPETTSLSNCLSSLDFGIHSSCTLTLLKW